jgi:hypothetical protein
LDGAYLDEQSFCDQYHIGRRTAQRWRVTGDGPPFVRVGPRRVIYRLSDCEAWAATRTHRHRAAELAKTAAAAPSKVAEVSVSARSRALRARVHRNQSTSPDSAELADGDEDAS